MNRKRYTKNGRTRKKNSRVVHRRLMQEVAGIILVFLAVLGIWSLFAQVEQKGLGFYLWTISAYAAGRTLSFIPILYLLGMGLFLLWRQRRIQITGFWLGSLIICLVILTGFDLIQRNATWEELATQAGAQAGGGLFGGGLSVLARWAFTRTGAWFFLAASAMVGTVLITGEPIMSLLGLHRAIKKQGAGRKDKLMRDKGKSLKVKKEPLVSPAPVETKTAPAYPFTPQPAAVRPLPNNSAPGMNTSQLFSLPGLDLLNPLSGARLTRVSADQRRRLEETLASFGVRAKVVEVHRGPVITRYDLQPAAGVKVSRIVNLADDLALALAARGLRIEAPIPGKAALGIEVPNKEPQPVTLREVLSGPEFGATSQLGFALGRDIAGAAVVGDLAKMPHLLVAGATGSGKSVCLNTIVMSLLYKAGPDRIKFIMIDPKMVELTSYNGIPHLIAPVVTEAKRAPSALKWAVAEMEQRYRRMMETGSREIEAYNRAQKDREKILPYVVIVIDELADLMMIARVEVEDLICRLAQMARATGMHLVIATQRPSVDVITGLIKANIPSRIAFAVSSLTDSRTILDCGGAERLLGRGDMLYAPVGAHKPHRIQGAYVGEDEVTRVVDFWRKQAAPAAQTETPVFKEESRRNERDPAKEDELFWQAVQVVVDHRQASASVLQRRLRVGYTRAARLVDLMEAKGYVGPADGSKPREVRITGEQLAAARDTE